MTVLVTGATGFVGAAVVRALLDQGTAVRVLRRRESNLRNLRDLDVESCIGDLCTGEGLAAAVKGCSGLYHVAADYRLWVRQPEQLYATNVNGTEKLLRLAVEAGVARIVYTSSVATLGSGADSCPADEATPVSLGDMIGHYKRSKFLAEELVSQLVEQGFPVVIVNPSTPIGPRDVKPTPTGRVILDAANGRIPAYVDTGLNVVHVDDVADGHLLAFAHGRVGERYILGGEDLTLKQILSMATARAGRTPPRVQLPHWAVIPVAVVSEMLASLNLIDEPLATRDGIKMARKKMFFSSARAREQLGYQARPAVQAIEAAVDWFAAEGLVRSRNR